MNLVLADLTRLCNLYVCCLFAHIFNIQIYKKIDGCAANIQYLTKWHNEKVVDVARMRWTKNIRMRATLMNETSLDIAEDNTLKATRNVYITVEYLSLSQPTLVYVCKGSYSFLTNKSLNVNTYTNSEANR